MLFRSIHNLSLAIFYRLTVAPQRRTHFRTCGTCTAKAWRLWASAQRVLLLSVPRTFDRRGLLSFPSETHSFCFARNFSCLHVVLYFQDVFSYRAKGLTFWPSLKRPASLNFLVNKTQNLIQYLTLFTHSQYPLVLSGGVCYIILVNTPLMCSHSDRRFLLTEGGGLFFCSNYTIGFY